ncbi:hypothetical protein HYFRA_00002484 [Hymenoscyphus fraxineus]|uniref:Rhodanese domain-containing protein n=1 Tax=Hymenoscyphus fraxineus TaxID=746836 RepID=A0A9N9L9F4_9HELO|nr:hypothetical protein HYFRA_00002484 [Hymenoscyphus fraxineus]
MLAPRLATCLLRASRSSITRPARQLQLRTLPAITPRNAPTTFKPTPRFNSQAASPQSKTYTYTEVKHFSENPSPNVILVDTREPAELQSTGTIPGSLNIPVSSVPEAFFLGDDDFEERFGFVRPAKVKRVIFYCKAGVRSRAAAELARQAGWVNASEYPGSWLDWEKNGGAKQSIK